MVFVRRKKINGKKYNYEIEEEVSKKIVVVDDVFQISKIKKKFLEEHSIYLSDSSAKIKKQLAESFEKGFEEVDEYAIIQTANIENIIQYCLKEKEPNMLMSFLWAIAASYRSKIIEHFPSFPILVIQGDYRSHTMVNLLKSCNSPEFIHDPSQTDCYQYTDKPIAVSFLKKGMLNSATNKGTVYSGVLITSALTFVTRTIKRKSRYFVEVAFNDIVDDAIWNARIGRLKKTPKFGSYEIEDDNPYSILSVILNELHKQKYIESDEFAYLDSRLAEVKKSWHHILEKRNIAYLFFYDVVHLIRSGKVPSYMYEVKSRTLKIWHGVYDLWLKYLADNDRFVPMSKKELKKRISISNGMNVKKMKMGGVNKVVFTLYLPYYEELHIK